MTAKHSVETCGNVAGCSGKSGNKTPSVSVCSEPGHSTKPVPFCTENLPGACEGWEQSTGSSLSWKAGIFFPAFPQILPNHLFSAGAPHPRELVCSSECPDPGKRPCWKSLLHGCCSMAFHASFPLGPALSYCWGWCIISSSLSVRWVC